MRVVTYPIILTNSESRLTVSYTGDKKEKLCEVTMPNGELLKGKVFMVVDPVVNWWIDGNNYSSTGSHKTIGKESKYLSILESTKPNSNLKLEIHWIWNNQTGENFGEAKTNDGRSFKVILDLRSYDVSYKKK